MVLITHVKTSEFIDFELLYTMASAEKESSHSFTMDLIFLDYNHHAPSIILQMGAFSS
ncbi:hypothetical protein QWZ13_05980 [Reinekea marina]|uniref:hypothetical protein n=1 Tax=Reinekea marina TaxID=1310421 RepID=UPI0025B32170|nr:hypothetical protein [Reinekea marina]MDN3648455.1 hypothetical protein [Reinekea marina]